MGTTYGTQLVVGFLVDCEAFFAGQKATVSDKPEKGWSCRVPVLGGFSNATVEELDAKGQIVSVKLSNGAVKKLNKKEREALKTEQPDECWKQPDGTTTEDRYELIEAWAGELGCSIDHVMGADDLLTIELIEEQNKEIVASLPVVDSDEEFGLGGSNAAYDATTIRIEYVAAALPQLIALRDRLTKLGFVLPKHPAVHSVLTAG